MQSNFAFSMQKVVSTSNTNVYPIAGAGLNGRSSAANEERRNSISSSSYNLGPQKILSPEQTPTGALRFS